MIEEQKIDLEDSSNEFVIISAADDSESISIFDTEKIDPNGKPLYTGKIKKAANAPESLK